MFNEFIGNDPTKEILRRLIQTRRIPHSLLFVGKEGIGKKQFALELAKSFVCQNKNELEACDDCKNCHRASNYNLPKPDDKDSHQKVIYSGHPDIGTVIPYKNSILVDAIRNLEEEANFLPYESNARFFIIDNAEKLSITKDNAANALLKTLEEPAESTYIFLITAQPSSLLPTILSRCQMIRFAPIENKEIENYLINKNYPTEDASLIASISRGSIGKALETNLEKYREQRDKMLKALESLISNQSYLTLLRTSEDLSDPKNKESYENNLQILQTLIHDLWTSKNNPNSNIINFDLNEKLANLSNNCTNENLSKWLIEIETLRENLSSNLNRKIATDALFMKMAD
jgi:DNA polymerase-3 subunit delta'